MQTLPNSLSQWYPKTIMQRPVKQKILYLITKSNFGGAQRYVYDLATTLPKESFEVQVACGGEGALTERLYESGIPTLIIPNLIRNVNIFQDILVFRHIVRTHYIQLSVPYN